MLWESSGEGAGLTVTARNKIPDIWKQNRLYFCAVIAYDNCCNLWWMCGESVCSAIRPCTYSMCVCLRHVNLLLHRLRACVCVWGGDHAGWMVLISLFWSGSHWSTVELITLIVLNAAAANTLWIVSFLLCCFCSLMISGTSNKVAPKGRDVSK